MRTTETRPASVLGTRREWDPQVPLVERDRDPGPGVANQDTAPVLASDHPMHHVVSGAPKDLLTEQLAVRAHREDPPVGQAGPL